MRCPLPALFWLAVAVGVLTGTAHAAAAVAASAPAVATSAPLSPHALPGGMTDPAVQRARERNRPKPVLHYVDINSASRKELMTLQGIGAAEADQIVAHRPYLTKTELVTKGVLPTGPFLSIKHQIVAMQKFDSKKVAAAKPPRAAASSIKAP
jgi:hypothetical protein